MSDTKAMRRLILITVFAALVAAPPVSAAKTKPLTITQAKRAVKAKADRLAGQPTKVGTILTTGRGRYYAQASWTKVDPAGCKGCGFNEETLEVFDTASETPCWAGFNVSRSKKTRRIVVRLREQMCP